MSKVNNNISPINVSPINVNEESVTIHGKKTTYEIKILPARTNKCSSLAEALNEVSKMQPMYVLKTVTVETLTGDELWKKEN